MGIAEASQLMMDLVLSDSILMEFHMVSGLATNQMDNSQDQKDSMMVLHAHNKLQFTIMRQEFSKLSDSIPCVN